MPTTPVNKVRGSPVMNTYSCPFEKTRDDTGSVIQALSWSGSESYFYETLAGEKTENYYARKSAGDLIPHTSIRRTSKTGANTGGSQYLLVEPNVNYGTTTVTSDLVRPFPSTPAPWYVETDELNAYTPDPDDISYEIQRAAANIASQGHDTLTFLAELAKVKRLFKQTIKNLLTLRYPKDYKAFAADWLAIRYGWRTLIFDLDSLNSAIREFDVERTRYQERSGSRQTYDLETVTDSNFGSLPIAIETTTVTTKVEVSIRGNVNADIEPDRFQLNPVNTAWELLPWSFVLDWLLNVGQALMALTFYSQSTNEVASGGYKITFNRTAEIVRHTYASGYSGNRQISGYMNAYILEREPQTVSYVPKIRLRLDEWKILDLLALVVSRFK